MGLLRTLRGALALALLTLLVVAQPALAATEDDETGDAILGAVGVVGVVIVFFAVVLPYLRSERRKREQSSGNVAAAGEIVEGRLVELGEQIRAFDIDVELPSASSEARAAYAQAVESYRAGSLELERARTLDDQRRAAQTAALGRHQMRVASALLSGEPAPGPFVPPCFIDPTHGDATTTVDYPEGGVGLRVPACARCAHRRAAAERAAAAPGREQRPQAIYHPPLTPTPPPPDR